MHGVCKRLCLSLRRLGDLAACALLLSALAACATAPGTGRSFFTGGLSEEGEADLGRQEHPKVLAEFGGAYDDPELARYVSSVGDFLVQTSERSDLKFTFTVLDSPVVNAFALPGGYVYVTRGLLALANSEAEMAGVVGHEIGHVTARHAAERYGQTVAANVATIGLGVLLGGPAAQAGSVVGGLLLRSYSRDQEFEADLLGGRYLARAGYDTNAMAGLLSQLQAHSRLEAALAGQPEKADEFDIMQTHPRTADRIERALQQAGATPVADPLVAQNVYFDKIDGMIYGDSPEEGYIRGRRFAHPQLKFTFEVPPGFRLHNQSRAVVARDAEGKALIKFDRAPKPYSGSMVDYLTRVWGAQVRLTGVEGVTINGLPAATGAVSANGQDFRLVVVRYDADTIYRFIFASARDRTAALNVPFRETTYSFRKLSDAEAAALQPRRLRIHTVKAGETPAAIAARMPFGEEENLQRFLALNGLTGNAGLRAGQRVKIVVE